MLLDAGVAAREESGACAAARELIRARRLLRADLWFTDLEGRQQRTPLSADVVTEELFRKGWGNGAMLILPQARQPAALDSRHVLERAQQEACARCHADVAES